MKIDPAKLNRKEGHDLLAAAVIPRPIAFVSTIGENVVYNLSPFSFFAVMSVEPPVVGFAIGPKSGGGKKDTLLNIEYAKDFVVNMVTEEYVEKMNLTSGAYPPEVDEFKVVGLTPVKSESVKSPRLAESPVNLECRLIRILKFGKAPRLEHFVIGEVIRAHVRDELWGKEGIDFARIKAIGRLGGIAYCRTRDIFDMDRPKV